MKSIIISEDLSFSYSSKPEDNVLNSIDLEIKEGSFVSILGHNGSGKSTFAKTMNAVIIPDSGKMTVNGYDTSKDDIYCIRQSAGMVFQNPDNQIVAAIVEDDVAFAPENLGVEPSEIRKRVDNALKAVGMYEYRKYSPSKLSGGQKQKVAIAGIIAMRPKCVILDEPTAMLDPAGRKEVMKTLFMLREKFGITVVLITHYMEEAAQTDRVIVMDSGKIILDDIPSKVFSQIECLKRIGLDVPQTTQLLWELKKRNIDVRTDIITEDECFAELFRILKN